MKFKVITIGKIKNKNLLGEVEELRKRISRLDVIELREIKDKNIDIIKKKEQELIEKNISSSDFNILLWEHAKELSTKEFYDKIKLVDKTICFIITGAFGPSEELKKKVDFHLSLSKMTFTHEQALYMLIEQIYRAQCFDRNIDYNK